MIEEDWGIDGFFEDINYDLSILMELKYTLKSKSVLLDILKTCNFDKNMCYIYREFKRTIKLSEFLNA